MRRLLVICVLGICAAARADEPITAQNWRHNPSIIEAHNVYLQVHEALKRHWLEVKVRRFDCPRTVRLPDHYGPLSTGLFLYSYPARVRKIALAADGTPRFYYIEAGSGDYTEDQAYYYDALGVLRFVLVRAGLANGPHIVRRIYYSMLGTRLWEDDQETGGDAHSFGASANLVLPLDSFNLPPPCAAGKEEKSARTWPPARAPILR